MPSLPLTHNGGFPYALGYLTRVSISSPITSPSHVHQENKPVLSSIYEFLGNWGYHHPIHPTEVHMPIGLVVGAVIFAMLIQPGFTISQDVSTTCSNLNCHGEIHLNRIW